MTVPTKPSPCAREDTRVARVEYVLRLIAEGRLFARHDVVLAKRWAVAPTNAREIIAEARRAWRRVEDPGDLIDLREECVARLDRIYRTGLRTGDLSAALGAVRERARIAGLGKVVVEMRDKTDKADEWTTDDEKGEPAH